VAKISKKNPAHSQKATEGKVKEEKTRGRPRAVLLDHLITINGNRRHGQLKEMAQYRED